MNKLTDTKKLVVPSNLSNVPGNNRSQVSSPYITIRFPNPTLSCVSRLSWCAKLDVPSDSAILKIMSEKDGTEPVIMAFSRGMVTVGGSARAVNGCAAPDRISLCF